MFVNCPNCSALVATDLATDLPPERCPRCGFALRDGLAQVAAGPAPAAPPAPVRPAAPTPTEPATPSAPATPPPVPAPAMPAAVPTTPPAGSSGAPGATPDPAPPTPPAAAAAAPPQPPAPAATSAEATEAAASADEDDVPAAAARRPSDDTAANAPDATEQPHDGEGPKTPAPEPAPGAGHAGGPAKPAPSFAQRHLRATGVQALRRRWPAVAAAVTLTLLLVLQLLLADRARLAADPQWRPLLASVCDTIGCTLPPWREPEAIVLLQRDVRPHPGLAGVLRVNATFRNDARWTQAWPYLVLRLSDIDGRTLGQRRFPPEEYLGQPPAPAGMTSGQRATVRIDVLEPSPHTVAFNFDFE
ncbi:DUF3426 domain-containing protein [Luteimonas sp. R10]|uniref:DUF3426 domain-containing protein n=1 Tax=Luteimonas sp. R10 TaxID=3108176 RepID=UPI003084EFD4|nr:DUF3426 domain-containing protein [Luteimonas sp. R10]